MKFGNHTDFQKVNELRNVLLEIKASSPSAGDVVQAQIWYNSAGSQQRIEFRDGSAVIKVPRLDYQESVSARWNFTSTGQPFTVTSTTRVDNLNAHYLADSGSTGRLADATAAANTIVLRDANARLKAADPSASDDVVNLGYMTAYVAGIRDPKEAARVATTANLAATRSSNTLTATANGSINTAGIDGVTNLAVNDRALVKNQSTGADNGIYIITDLGSASTPWVMQRSADADSSAEVTNGVQIWITSGTTNGSSGWLLTTADPITLNTTALTFIQINGSAQLLQGNGIDITGNTISVKISASTTYTTGAVLYNGSTSTITGFTTAGVLQVTSGAAPTAATGTQYGVPYWATTTTLGTTAAGTATTVLHGNASGAPTWSAVSLTADVSGTLPVANGGTGAATLSGIVYGNGTSALTAGNGTAGTIAKFSASSPGLADSIIVETASLLTIAGSITLTGAQTFKTSTGQLDIKTGGAGAIVCTPNSGSNFSVVLAGAGDFIVNTNQLYVDTSAGSVGIGTTSPGAKLTVVQSSGAVGTIGGGGIFTTAESGATTIGNRGAAGLTIQQVNGTNNNFADIVFRGGGSSTDIGYFGMQITNHSTNAGDFYWSTQTNERVRITSGGFVGIGTTGPTAKLHILDGGTATGAVASVVSFFQSSTIASTNSRIAIVSGTTGVAGLAFGDTASATQGRLDYDNNTDRLDIIVANARQAGLSAAGVFDLNNSSYTASKLVQTDASKNLITSNDLPSAVTLGAKTIAIIAEGSVSGGASPVAYTHNLGRQAKMVQVRDSSNNLILVDWRPKSGSETTIVELLFSADTTGQTYTVDVAA